MRAGTLTWRAFADQREVSPWAVLGVMCVGYFLVLLDVTIVNVALPTIGSDLGTGVSGLQWVVDGYALVLAALMLAGGTVGDVRGHKRIVLAGLVVFGAGSLGCAIAADVAVLIAARVVQGIGAALLLPGTLAIISRAFPKSDERARAIGVWAGVGSLALPAGPLLGGLLIAGFGWRAVFLINVPVVIASFLVALGIVRESVDRKVRRLDPAGVALGTAILVATTFAFIEGGRDGVAAPAVVAAAVCAVLFLVTFVLVEWRCGEEAMLPLGLFRRAQFSIANGAAGAMNLGSVGTLFVLTLFLQSVQHHSPLVAGLEIVPLFMPLAILAPLAGRLTGRIGPRLPVAAGLGAAAAGMALLNLAGERSGYAVLLPAFLLWGIGLGILTPAVVAAAIAAVSAERVGLASAINNTSRQAGGAIGIAVAGAIAGQPSKTGSFLSGFHAVATAAATLYLILTLLVLALLPGRLAPR